MGPLYRPKRFQDSMQVNFSYGSSDKSEPIFLPITMRRDRRTSQETGSGKGTESGNSQLLFRLFLKPKKNGKLRPVIDLSLLNQYIINKQPFKMETVKSVRQSIMVNDWAFSIDLTDAYLHVPIHPISRKYLQFIYGHQIFQFTDKRFDSQATNLSHKSCLQTVQNLGFIPNLKKSDLIPAQKFTLLGMEFLTQQNIVRVPANLVQSLILTIKTFLSQTQVSAQTFLSLLGKLSAAADFILLGRLHLRPLQMCL